jgi:hypothetical protein
MHGIKDNLEVRYLGAAIANASNTDNNSTRIDMANYESVLFVCTVTDSVATGVATITIEQNDADSDSGMAAVTGTGATLTCAVNDDINGKLIMTELRNPMKRYVQAVRTSATANIAYGEIIAILTPMSLPVSQHSTVGDVNYVSN